MANYICISSIRITSETENKVLTKSEIEQFCEKRIQISVTKTSHNLCDNALNCRVVLNKMSKDYIRNALNGQMNKNEQKHELKPLNQLKRSKVSFP